MEEAALRHFKRRPSKAASSGGDDPNAMRSVDKVALKVQTHLRRANKKASSRYPTPNCFNPTPIPNPNPNPYPPPGGQPGGGRRRARPVLVAGEGRYRGDIGEI